MRAVRGPAQSVREGWCTLRRMDVNTLEHEALGLPSNERARLAVDLIESLENLSDREVERLWLAESQRRVRQVDKGEVAMVPAEVVAARVTDLLR